MFPALAHTSIAQRNQCTDSEHKRVTFGLGGALVDECTEAGIFIIMEKVTVY